MLEKRKQRQTERDRERERERESVSCLGTRIDTWILVLAVVDFSVFLQSDKGHGQRTSLSTHLCPARVSLAFSRAFSLETDVEVL